MKKVFFCRVIALCAVAAAILIAAALPGASSALGTGSDSGEEARPEIRIVLLPQSGCAGGGGIERIRVTCDIDYSRPGENSGRTVGRRSVILAGRSVVLVTVAGRSSPARAPIEKGGGDKHAPHTSANRISGRSFACRLAAAAYCLKAIAEAVWSLIV